MVERDFAAGVEREDRVRGALGQFAVPPFQGEPLGQFEFERATLFLDAPAEGDGPGDATGGEQEESSNGGGGATGVPPGAGFEGHDVGGVVDQQLMADGDAAIVRFQPVDPREPQAAAALQVEEHGHSGDRARMASRCLPESSRSPISVRSARSTKSRNRASVVTRRPSSVALSLPRSTRRGCGAGWCLEHPGLGEFEVGGKVSGGRGNRPRHPPWIPGEGGFRR